MILNEEFVVSVNLLNDKNECISQVGFIIWFSLILTVVTMQFTSCLASQVVALTLKASITTAADDKFCDIFPNFRMK